MITATKNPANENANDEFLQARNKLKKVSSNGITENITTEEKGTPSVEMVSENTSESNHQERTLAILTATSDLDDIIQHIKSNGFTVIATKMLELTAEEAEEFYQDHVKQNYYEKGVRWLSSSKLCALVLEKENAIKDWRQLMGPTTYKKARKTSPNSIRALFGKDASQNATHGSDSDVSAGKEIEYLFGADLAATASASVVVEEPSETQHEKLEILGSEVKQVPEGNDVTAPVSEKEEPNNDIAKDTIVSVEESNVPKANVEESQKHGELESKKGIEATKEETKNSNGSEAKAEIGSSDQDQTHAKSNGDMSNAAAAKDEEKHKTTKPTVEKAEIADHEEKKELESSTIVAAANTVTSTAASVATTVVTGVTEVASAAVTAVTAVVASSGTEEKTDSDDATAKTVTIEEIPIIHDIIIPEPKKPEESPVEPQQIKMKYYTETNNVVPEIKATDTHHHQDKSNSISDLKASTSSNNTDNSDKSCPEEDSKSAVETSTDQGDNSSRTSASDVVDAKESNIPGNAQQSATKKAVRKSAVHPSNSRIKPPSVNKGHSNATKTSLPDQVKKPAEGSDHKVRSQSRTTRASSSGGSSGSNGATRIARLSAPIKKAAAPPNSVAAEQQQQQPIKKAVTKVSKNLPRVATLAKPPVSSSKAAEQDVKDSAFTTEKPKKRLSSTKSFISRLTAPTVASANKKAAATTTATETEAPTRRTSTLKKRQSLTVKPTSIEAQGPNKANNTQQQEQQQLNSEMTSISTNGSLSRPTTPPPASHEKENEGKNQAFIDTSVKTAV
ncbi:hypothetical protein G6F42_008266 [Rhizopus arrhizus]|nr:hypothetical protein G6F42_008266 [Rhizopus arrhizus]